MSTIDVAEWIRVGWDKATHCHRCGKEEPDKWLCSYGWCRECNKFMTELVEKICDTRTFLRPMAQGVSVPSKEVGPSEEAAGSVQMRETVLRSPGRHQGV